MKRFLTLYFLCSAFAATAQTQTICNAPKPAGWITTGIHACSSWLSLYYGRTLQLISSLPVNQTVNIVGDMPPAGWATTSMTSFGPVLGSFFIKRSIKNLNTVPVNTTLNIAGDPTPAGWACVNMFSYGPVSGSLYLGRTIKRISELNPNGDVIYGDMPPAGWVTTAIASTGAINGSLYYKRTIRRIDNLPANSVISICADNIPSGWASTAISNCGPVNNSFFYARTIRKIEGLPLGSVVYTCGDVLHPGWTVQPPVAVCANIVGGNFNGYNIKKTANVTAARGTAAPYADVITESLSFAEQPELTITPNPSLNFFTLRLPATGYDTDLRVTVYNSAGMRVEELTVPAHNGGLDFGHRYPAGYYLVHVSGASFNQSLKVIKQ